MHGFMFATGIENSYPTIAGGVRIDQMEQVRPLRALARRPPLVRDLGIHYLRWGPALHRRFSRRAAMTGPGPTRSWPRCTDWTSIPSSTCAISACPTGWATSRTPTSPATSPNTPSAFAARYPHAKYWTPVNEILITTLFSAKYGWWNEMLTTDEAYVRATLNVCRANLLAMQAILATRPRRHLHPERIERIRPPFAPDLIKAAELLQRAPLPPAGPDLWPPGQRRHLSLSDGTRHDGSRLRLLHESEFRFRCIMGTDYYVTNEHLLARRTTIASGEFFGYYVIAKQYYDRYGLPLMHTETNIKEEEAGAVAMERMELHAAAAPGRRADRRLHLVQPDRSDRLGHRLARSATASIRSACTTSTPSRARWARSIAADPGVARLLADRHSALMLV